MRIGVGEWSKIGIGLEWYWSIVLKFAPKPALLLSPKKFIFHTQFLGFLRFMKDFE
jgi:hypothetical protein